MQDGESALSVACANGHLEVVQWLVSSAGSSAATERNDVCGLHWDCAVCCADARTCGICVQSGRTALLCACEKGHLEVAQWLVSSAGSSAATERNNVRRRRGIVVPDYASPRARVMMTTCR